MKLLPFCKDGKYASGRARRLIIMCRSQCINVIVGDAIITAVYQRVGPSPLLDFFLVRSSTTAPVGGNREEKCKNAW